MKTTVRIVFALCLLLLGTFPLRAETVDESKATDKSPFEQAAEKKRAEFLEALKIDRQQGEQSARLDRNDGLRAKLSRKVLDSHRAFVSAVKYADNRDPIRNEDGTLRPRIREEWHRCADEAKKDPEDVKKYYLFLHMMRMEYIMTDEDGKLPDLRWFAKTAASKTGPDAKFIAETLSIIADYHEEQSGSRQLSSSDARNFRLSARLAQTVAEPFWHRALSDIPSREKLGVPDSMPLRIPKGFPASSMMPTEYEEITQEETDRRLNEQYEMAVTAYLFEIRSSLATCLFKQGRFVESQEMRRELTPPQNNPSEVVFPSPEQILEYWIIRADDCAERGDAKGREEALAHVLDMPGVWDRNRLGASAFRDLMQLLQDQNRNEDMVRLLKQCFEATRDLPRQNMDIAEVMRYFFHHNKPYHNNELVDELVARIIEILRLRRDQLRRADAGLEIQGSFEQLIGEAMLYNERSPTLPARIAPKEELFWEMLPYVSHDWNLTRFISCLLHPNVKLPPDVKLPQRELDQESYKRFVKMAEDGVCDLRVLKYFIEREKIQASPFVAELRRREKMLDAAAAPLVFRLDAALESKDWQAVIRLVEENPESATISFEAVIPRLHRAAAQAHQKGKEREVQAVLKRLADSHEKE